MEQFQAYVSAGHNPPPVQDNGLLLRLHLLAALARTVLRCVFVCVRACVRVCADECALYA